MFAVTTNGAKILYEFGLFQILAVMSLDNPTVNFKFYLSQRQYFQRAFSRIQFPHSMYKFCFEKVLNNYMG